MAVVEVAATVRTERTSAEVVPIETLSLSVVSLTKVPSSVQPDGVPPELSSVPQIRLPEESVCRRLVAPEQLRVEILAPPPEITRPEARVEVELVLV